MSTCFFLVLTPRRCSSRTGDRHRRSGHLRLDALWRRGGGPAGHGTLNGPEVWLQDGDAARHCECAERARGEWAVRCNASIVLVCVRSDSDSESVHPGRWRGPAGDPPSAPEGSPPASAPRAPADAAPAVGDALRESPLATAVERRASSFSPSEAAAPAMIW